MLNVDGSRVWSSAVVNVVDTENAPIITDTEIPGTRAGVGTPSYAGLSIGAGPYRTGGSVNMFGDQIATTRTFAAGSSFNFDRNTSITTNYSYSCELTEKTEFYTPPVIIPGTPVQGYYVVNPSANGNDDANQRACDARNAIGSTHPGWGDDTQQCLFVKTGDAVPETTIPGFWTAGPDLVTVVPGQSASQTDVTNEYNLVGLDSVPYTENGNWFVDKVVICISPKKLPGIWTKQNGYTGINCNTAYFNTAPWGGGSQTSNGTYISVPGL
jgi:hypothetical protein